MSALYFAQIREDARVERAFFEGARRVLVVASGGCTALSLLDDRVDAVHAVDANPAQTELLALKVAAMRALDLDDLLVAFGEAPGDRAGLFARLGLRPDPESAARGLLHGGANERFYRFLGDNLRRNVLPDGAWDALLAAPDVAAQRRWLATHATSEAFEVAVRVLLSRTTHEHFFPPAMFAHVSERHFGDFFLERFVHELETRPVADSPFLHQLLAGRYPPRARPRYLTPDGYAAARRNLDKLEIITAPLQALPEPTAPYDALALSNVLDWAGPDDADAIAARVRAVSAPGARVVLRQMLDARPLPARLGLRDAGSPASALERSMLYRSVICGRLP